jgi:hypothetical protein
LYKGNDRYLPWCKDCVDNLYEHYKRVLGSEEAAVRRTCLHLDVYWNQEIFNSLGFVSADRPLFRSYLEKANQRNYAGKTYDDTLDEEAMAKAEEAKVTGSDADSCNEANKSREQLMLEFGVTHEDEEFWGDQFEPKQYPWLAKRFIHWTSNKGELTVSQESLYKQLCITELRIDQEVLTGDPSKVTTLQSSLTNIMQKIGITPSQNKESELAEKNTFAVIVKKLEARKKIRDYQEKNRLIVLYTIYYLGHLCKMLNLNNKYSKLYEDEMARYRVERPDLEGADDDTVFESVFAEALKSVENGDLPDAKDLVLESQGDVVESN